MHQVHSRSLTSLNCPLDNPAESTTQERVVIPHPYDHQKRIQRMQRGTVRQSRSVADGEEEREVEGNAIVSRLAAMYLLPLSHVVDVHREDELVQAEEVHLWIQGCCIQRATRGTRITRSLNIF